ncbi:hypothetical protein AVEN_112456-1 [Araneus ventricosus]|uniref:Uncharacterized protein n=1 Tax=Araneus ventricosus TaxID=182803 RepID=A0A4Y2M4F1_ARAVE|nr:hypothetical protein AVEN_112456-1 [Araneus ventricosus]
MLVITRHYVMYPLIAEGCRLVDNCGNTLFHSIVILEPFARRGSFNIANRYGNQRGRGLGCKGEWNNMSKTKSVKQAIHISLEFLEHGKEKAIVSFKNRWKLA